ncbi:hypothetical protein [Rathayibacter rathayi]|uniref:hypothetical protein n=1 Tax=Rathayibacter rathayi TaxID=33887 RepID=UPI001CA52F14|nr:hypothetical protein [Rathayibacter rathayi]
MHTVSPTSSGPSAAQRFPRGLLLEQTDRVRNRPVRVDRPIAIVDVHQRGLTNRGLHTQRLPRARQPQRCRRVRDQARIHQLVTTATDAPPAGAVAVADCSTLTGGVAMCDAVLDEVATSFGPAQPAVASANVTITPAMTAADNARTSARIWGAWGS